MGIDALTHRDDGTLRDPAVEGWDEWVSASATRNYALDDPILDWLEMHGLSKGYESDLTLPGYDARTDFREFLFRQGPAFETRVLEYLRTVADVRTMAADHTEIRTREAAERTFEAMRDGVEVLYQGVLWDAEHGVHGAPDLLVRSDVVERLFPGTLSAEALVVPASDLLMAGGGGAWHYRVVDVKFTSLHLNAAGTEVGNSGSSTAAYKVQLFLYNRALGRIQGYEPPAMFLLGRSSERKQKGQTFRNMSALALLGPIPRDGGLAHGRSISSVATGALHWRRRVKSEGASWEVTPQPSVPELYPDASNAQDQPWHAAKRQIAHDLDELTMLWQVGVEKRNEAHRKGILRWTDPTLTPEDVGIKASSVYHAPLTSILAINRNAEGPAVLRGRGTDEATWRVEPPLEFFADFETFGDLRDDFSAFPERGGQALIFMIGCGHLEGGEWTFRCFVAEEETETAEAEMIDEWLSHMEAVRQRLAPSLPAAQAATRVMHWSSAEKVTFETAYNSAKARHPEKGWPSPNWLDFLDVMRKEPVVIRGAMGYGLKAVARALYGHGRIRTIWPDGPSDGLGAMMGGWWCYDEARRTGTPVTALDLMQEIVRYNEVDCQAMQEVVFAVRGME